MKTLVKNMSKTNTRMLLRCAVFAALTAVGAFIRIPFALSSITLQFFFTAMAGLVLGARWGAASQAIYVLLGLAGLPIFSAGGGAGYIFYPSFGFLLGLIPAAYVTGRLCGGCKARRVVEREAAGRRVAQGRHDRDCHCGGCSRLGDWHDPRQRARHCAAV